MIECYSLAIIDILAPNFLEQSNMSYFENVSKYLSGLSANNNNWRWWDSDMQWHLNPF